MKRTRHLLLVLIIITPLLSQVKRIEKGNLIIEDIPDRILNKIVQYQNVKSATSTISYPRQSENSWNRIINLKFGYFILENDWKYTHPQVSSSGGFQNINETGIFKGKLLLSSGFELSKGYKGFQLNAGIFQGEIKVNKSEEIYIFNSMIVEAAGRIFPTGYSTNRSTPFMQIGGGGIITVGDLDNTALFFLIGGGLRIYITEKIGTTIMLNGRYMTYNEIPVAEYITGDIRVTPITAEINIFYHL